MNRRSLILAVAALAVALFAVAAYYVSSGSGTGAADAAILERPHSPVVGAADAPVTIVEFLDPACEACRAFHPVIKSMLRQFPDDVRVVVRYATFHNGSEEAVRILEAARLQGMYEPVLDTLFKGQPKWASHSTPNLAAAWDMAAAAGLDVQRARVDAGRAEIAALLRQDAEDIRTLQVKQTPTFYIAGKPLETYQFQAFYDAVRTAVEAARNGTAQ